MNIQEIKDLMSQFDQSSLREFTYQNATDALSFSNCLLYTSDAADE